MYILGFTTLSGTCLQLKRTLAIVAKDVITPRKLSVVMTRIGLVKAERLGQRLNVPTQGQRVTQTGTKPSHLRRWDQIPSQESNPGRIGERPTC